MCKNKKEKGLSKYQALKVFITKLKENEALKMIVSILLMFICLYGVLAYFSFIFNGTSDASNHGNESQQILNAGGNLGNSGANSLINNQFGLSSIFLILLLGITGYKILFTDKVKLLKTSILFIVLTLWGSLFCSYVLRHFLSKDAYIQIGGECGNYICENLKTFIGNAGISILLLFVIISVSIISSKRVRDYIKKVLSLEALKRKGKAPKEEKTESEKKEDSYPTESYANDEIDVEDKPITQKSKEEYQNEEEETVVGGEKLGNKEIDINNIPMTVEQVREEEEEEETDDTQDKEKEEEEEMSPEFTIEVKEDEEYTSINDMPFNPRLDLEHYKYPTIDLLKEFNNSEPVVDPQEQQENKEKIIRTLSSFGIEITNIKATVGPTVTLYEITPKEGVRISKIRGLEDDIALSLAALGIRIIAPIPGKGTIGIEVPNAKPRVVSGRSILGSKKFQETTFDLPIAIGKTITNEVFMVDLCKMPHVLVAGATGQGKSVGLNAIITSLLYKKHPSELKFVLVDPKKVEFTPYSMIEKHFLAKLPDAEEPIITDVKKVVQTLNSICIEMDTRYDLLKMANVRNMKEYNEKFIARKLNPDKGHHYLPYIVVIIDEFGDLIMTAGKEVELPIARIAQLARAVGIHMIIATQRPTTNIITGTIKANFPARIAFRVSAMVDSRTILDRAGANQLIGRGDMLFLQGAEPVRVQCAFIDTPEVNDITQFIAKQQSYTSAFLLPEYVDESGGIGAEDIDSTSLDVLFEEAARLIVANQQGSTSLIQRKFSIGYNRAGRLMDQLERSGIVGPVQGSKPREVLCLTEMELEEKLKSIL